MDLKAMILNAQLDNDNRNNTIEYQLPRNFV